MGAKITKPNTEESNYNHFEWDRFTKDCIKSKYVLVIGDHAILNKNSQDDMIKKANGNSTQFLFNWTKDSIAETVQDNSQNFTQFANNVHHLHSKVLDAIKDWDFKEQLEDEIEPTLKRLMETRCFRVVLTTSIDPYMEELMEKVWGEGNYRVLDIYGEESNKDLLTTDLNSGEFNEMTPTLYYIFGEADSKNHKKKFVLTENDAMSAVTEWINANRPKNILNYIQGAGMQIVAIGCNFDDWLFRFFWFSLRGDVKNLSSGQVAVEFHPERDKQLKNYLKTQGIEIFDDARGFMNDAANRIEESTKIGNLPRKDDGIFISYAHEDKYIALPLFYKLHKEGFSVWIDEERLDGGSQYKQRITNAINNCRIFMPILSSQVMHDLKEGKRRFYIDEEWSIAQKKHDDLKGMGESATNHSFNVLPIIVGGEYQIRSDYHQKTPPCIINVTAYYEVAKESPDSLTKLISKLLN